MKLEKNRYDNAWKDLVRELFFEFLDFYYPDLSREVDHTVRPQSRDKELAKLLPENLETNRTADLLFRVNMRDGKRSLLLHIEIQNRKEEDLAKRLFQYAYRIFDREGNFPATMLLLTDGDPHFYPTGFEVSLGAGRFLRLDFFTRKLLYLREELSLLPGVDCLPCADSPPGGAEERNPFSFVNVAHLEALKDRRQVDKYRLKLKLTRRLVSQGWDIAYGERILRFLDWMLQLPEELEELYDGETKTILKEERMPYVTSWERRALKQGLEQGLEQGIEQGLGQGELKEKRRVLCRLVEKKFGGGVSEKDTFEAVVEKMDDAELLEKAIDAVLDAESREDVLALLAK